MVSDIVMDVGLEPQQQPEAGDTRGRAPRSTTRRLPHEIPRKAPRQQPRDPSSESTQSLELETQDGVTVDYKAKASSLEAMKLELCEVDDVSCEPFFDISY